MFLQAIIVFAVAINPESIEPNQTLDFGRTETKEKLLAIRAGNNEKSQLMTWYGPRTVEEQVANLYSG